LLLVALVQTACSPPATGGSTPPRPAATSANAETPAPPEPAPATPQEDAVTTDTYHGLKPFRGVQAPAITKVQTVRFQTDAGELLIEVYPEAAPNAAKRFVELVEAGFYNQTPIFRIVPGFVAQFGVNWRPGMVNWKEKNFNDDPSLFELGPATLAFAKAGPNTNSTQVFINYGDNSQLKDRGGFSTFARVVQGFENTRNFKQVGDPSMGLDQGRLWGNGEQYLASLPANQKPTMILKAELVK
jgi:cyclophilin family peptidyl-prolyl cis-trans isomerase